MESLTRVARTLIFQFFSGCRCTMVDYGRPLFEPWAEWHDALNSSRRTAKAEARQSLCFNRPGLFLLSAFAHSGRMARVNPAKGGKLGKARRMMSLALAFCAPWCWLQAKGRERVASTEQPSYANSFNAALGEQSTADEGPPGCLCHAKKLRALQAFRAMPVWSPYVTITREAC